MMKIQIYWVKVLQVFFRFVFQFLSHVCQVTYQLVTPFGLPKIRIQILKKPNNVGCRSLGEYNSIKNTAINFYNVDEE